jgi:hypothetical protein
VKLLGEHERRYSGAILANIEESTDETGGEQRVVLGVLDVRKVVENVSSMLAKMMLGPFLRRFDDVGFIVPGFFSPRKFKEKIIPRLELSLHLFYIGGGSSSAITRRWRRWRRGCDLNLTRNERSRGHESSTLQFPA